MSHVSDWWKQITRRKEIIGGTPPWVHFLFICDVFPPIPDSVMISLDHVRSATKKGVTHCLTFLACSSTWNTEDWLTRKTSRLVDGCRSKYNGASCFSRNAVTNDKRRDMMHEIRLLPKCAVTGWPQILGNYRQWNQVVRCNRYHRTSYCHHCHWLLDHRLSMSDTNVLLFFQMVQWIYSPFVYVYTDWHDGGNVPWAHQPWQADEWRHCLSIEQFKSKLTELPVGMQLVMIGRRLPRYDTLEKVMTCLDKIFNVMSVMEQITVHVNVIHWACLLNLLKWLLMFFHVSCVFV